MLIDLRTAIRASYKRLCRRVLKESSGIGGVTKFVVHDILPPSPAKVHWCICSDVLEG
jgi:hypothetical protein